MMFEGTLSYNELSESISHSILERDLPVRWYTTQTGTWGPHMAGTCPESHSSTESPACSHAQTMCTRVKEIDHI